MQECCMGFLATCVLDEVWIEGHLSIKGGNIGFNRAEVAWIKDH